MRCTICSIATVAAFLVLAPTTDGAAATACPTKGQPYTIKGVVKNVGTTSDGQPYYSVLHPHCGSSEDNTIAVYPSAPVAGCTIGKHATASGSYAFTCPEEGDEFGGVCVATLSTATLKCK